VQAFATTQTLFGATGGGLSSLYKINPTNGTATPIDEITNSGTIIGVSGLDFFGGILYGAGQTRGSVTASIESIDPTTGAVISSHNTTPKCADISFAPEGTLYCISPNIPNPNPRPAALYTLDKATGDSHKVGDISFAIGGGVGGAIAVNPSNGDIFAGTSSALFTLDSSNGNTITAFNWIFPTDWSDLTCRPGAFAYDNAKTLYATFICADVVSGTDVITFLATVDTTTDTVTEIGPTIASLDSIAFEPITTPPPSIPEFPFSFSLVIMFVVVAAMYMGMRQKMTFGKPRL